MTLAVPIIDDDIVESATESFDVNIGNPLTAPGFEGRITTPAPFNIRPVTINDNDTTQVSIADAGSFEEPLSDATQPNTMTFTVHLSKMVDTDLTLGWQLGMGSAGFVFSPGAGADITRSSGVQTALTIPAKTNDFTISINTRHDSVDEATETFILTILSVAPAGPGITRSVAITDADATGTITDWGIGEWP